MTYEQYLKEANAYFVTHQKDLRYGQALANYLGNEVSPIAYIAACAADVDPFYNDDVVPEFLNFLSSNWSDITKPAQSL